jgi:pimeloyl-ACP methyl ester carboxylesterase
MRGRRWLVAGAFGATLILGGVLPVGPSTAAEADAGHAASGNGTQPTVTWRDCATVAAAADQAALQAVAAQCGRLAVPLDYTHPQGRSITVAFSRVPASDPAHRRGVLMLNPGGPGDTALGLVAAFKEGLPDIAARYDLIGMDPRFVGASTPVTCHWPTDFFLSGAGPDRQSFQQGVSFAQGLAAGCAGNADVLPYASTRNTARDMDQIRAALGEQRVSYVGWSYGSYLGSVYTQLFPQRVDRFVLDSAPDPDAYASGLWQSTPAATEAALRNWAGWAATRDATYHLGASVDAVLANVDGIYRAAARAPLHVGSYQVDSHVLPVLLFIPIRYDSDENYAAIAGDVVALKTAAAGTPVDPTDDLAANLALVRHAPADTTAAGATSVIFCADQTVSHHPQTYYRDIHTHRADEPHFAALTRNVTPCTFWPTIPVEAPTRISNNVPVLMVGSTGDPRTTYPGQLNLHRELTGSRLVTLAGAFRHVVYAAEDNDCVTGTVGAYLLDGTLPAADVTCHRSQPTTAARRSLMRPYLMRP